MLDESATCLGGFYVTSRASRSASTPASDSHPIHSFCSCSQCKIRPRLCFGSIISSRHAIFGLCLPVTVLLFSSLFHPIPLSSRHYRYPVAVTVIPNPLPLLSRTRHRYPVPVIVLPIPSLSIFSCSRRRYYSRYCVFLVDLRHCLHLFHPAVLSLSDPVVLMVMSLSSILSIRYVVPSLSRRHSVVHRLFSVVQVPVQFLVSVRFKFRFNGSINRSWCLC